MPFKAIFIFFNSKSQDYNIQKKSDRTSLNFRFISFLPVLPRQVKMVINLPL